MKTTTSFLFISLFLFVSFGYSQIVGTNAFMKGNYAEVGVNSCGVYGSNELPPVGYHPTSPFTGLSFVADPGEDGWESGSPIPYCGDYALPGSPVEGWQIEINGSFYTNTDGYCSPDNIPGNINSYSFSGGNYVVDWSGNVADMDIHQVSTLGENALYLLTTITLTNNGETAMSNIFYERNIDPDQDEPWTADFTTDNMIVANEPDTNYALVTSTGLTYGCYLGIGSRNPNARVSWGNFSTTDGAPSDVYNGAAGYSLSGSEVSDIATQISFYIPTLAAGDSVTFRFAYIFSSDAVDEALAATLDVCGPVTDNSVTAITSSSATINWTAHPDATYAIKYRKSVGGTWTTLTGITPPVNLSGLSSATGYTYTITANCGDGAIFPTTGTFTTAASSCATAPTGLFTTNITSSSAKAHWTAVPDVLKYQLSYKPSIGGTWTTVYVTTNSKKITGLSPSTTYRYKVRSVCMEGGAITYSPYSPYIEFTTSPLRSNGYEELQTISVYPDPSDGTFTLSLNDMDENIPVTVSIRDIAGKIVYEKTIGITENTSEKISIDASSGIYFLTVQQNDIIRNQKIMINK